jgi:hypothetical protein
MIETRHYTDDGGIYHPKLKVTLLPENVEGVPVPCSALVDSGADMCCFPEGFAKELGIDKNLLPQREIAGAYGEPETVHFGMVPIDLGFASYKTVIGFHKSDFAVLGQLGFFDHFKVAFDTANRQFIITDMAIPDEPNRSLKGDNVP